MTDASDPVSKIRRRPGNPKNPKQGITAKATMKEKSKATPPAMPAVIPMKDKEALPMPIALKDREQQATDRKHMPKIEFEMLKQANAVCTWELVVNQVLEQIKLEKEQIQSNSTKPHKKNLATCRLKEAPARWTRQVEEVMEIVD